MKRLILLLKQLAVLTAATSLRAQEYVRESGPQLFSYDELVQLSLNQEMQGQTSQ
jgi:hypothetical protein